MKLLTKNELAQRLQLSRSTIDRLVRAGRLPQPVRFSRKTVRWPVESIQTQIDKLSK
jgi:excisionase family DNA binding protein